jgi:hypothetical protein
MIFPAPVLAKISLRGQKETGTADRPRRVKILFFPGNPLQIHGFWRFRPGIFSAGIAVAKGALCQSQPCTVQNHMLPASAGRKLGCAANPDAPVGPEKCSSKIP